MNKKIIKIIIGGSLTILLMGCSNSTSKKYEDALVSLDSKDYAVSVTLLEEILENNPDNNEAKEILGIISNYQKALSLSNEDKFEDAKKILQNLSKAYSNYSIKEDIEFLASDLEKKINDKEVALVDDMFKKARSLFDEGKYTECKEFLDSDISPKVNLIKTLPEDTNITLASLYSECDKYIKEEQARIAKEEEDTRVTKEEYNSSLTVQSSTFPNSTTNSGSSDISNSGENSSSQNSTSASTSESDPTPEPTPVVTDESSNPFSNGEKNINGFNYWVKDANHWDANLYYNLVCAGMYNKITFNAPSTELAAILYYTDDSTFVYEKHYENSQSYTGSYFGTYNGRSVNYIIEFNY